MQPTLNGITAEATAEDPTPGLLGRLLGRLKGERYVNEVSLYEGALDPRQPLTEERFLIFMPYCLLHFQDGHTQKIGVPMRQLIEDFNFWRNIQSEVTTTGEITPDAREVQVLKAGGVYVHKGQLLARGILRNGDQVIVDKISYHFRRPQRGEVFVFTTKNIRVIESQSNFDPRQGSQHYIKRLAGVPGDHLQVEEPKLYINGKLAAEPGFVRVMQGSPDAPVDGYKGYGDARRISGLRINAIDIDNDHYFAMGDNSFNSFDSRGWGPVPARNLVGPALWTYWPLNKHWGPIK
jgi:signal peptidase I